jgi:hypothetical protein
MAGKSAPLVAAAKQMKPATAPIFADSETAEAESSRAFSFAGLVRWFCIATVLYVLSIGPVAKLMFAGRLSERTVTRIYAPLLWLGQTEVGEKLVSPCIRWYGEKVWNWKALVVQPLK